MAATTFRPPSSTPASSSPAPASTGSTGQRPRPKKKSPIVAVLIGLCVVLAGAAGFLFTKMSSQTASNAALQEGLLKVAGSAGSAAVTAENLVAAEAITGASGTLADEVAALVAGREQARTEIEGLRGEVAEIAREREAVAVRIAENQRQLETARANLQTSRTGLEELQAKYDADIAALQAQVTSLKDELTAAKAAMVEEETTTEAAGEVANASSVEATPAPVAETAPVAVEAASEDASAEPVVEPPPRPSEYSMVVPPGASQMFKTVRYETNKNRLTFVTMNDQKLVYTKVPAEIYDGLAAAPVIDVYYRFKIFDAYDSDPNDLEVMRQLRK